MGAPNLCCTCCCSCLPTTTGSFNSDSMEGQGTYYYANGDIYSGAFKAGKKHGSGQMFFKVGCDHPSLFLLLSLARFEAFCRGWL